MGWEIAEGPEVETEWFNFDALNFGPDHPARRCRTRSSSTARGRLVLRTHTSPVQVRTLLERALPVYVVLPGQIFRTDELDATHTPVFHQVEGLAVDKGLTIANLQRHARPLRRRMFGEGRHPTAPSFFPFTEPSAEMDLHWRSRRRATLAAGPAAARGGSSGRVRHGPPERAARLRGRPGRLLRLRVRHAHSAHPDVPLLVWRDMRDMVEGDVRFSQHYGMEI